MVEEDSLYSYQVLEQSVVMDLKELEVKNPTMATVDDLVLRIMDGSPGSELDKSMLEIDGSDAVVHSLAGGKSIMEMPESIAENDFSITDFAKKADAGEEDGDQKPDEDKEGCPDEKKEDEQPVDKNGKKVMFDAGEIAKVQTGLFCELATLEKNIMEEIKHANEKIDEYKASDELTKLYEKAPSLKTLYDVYESRVDLLKMQAPKALRLAALQSQPGHDKMTEANLDSKDSVFAAISAKGLDIIQVYSDHGNLQNLDELQNEVKCLGQDVTTMAALTACQKAFAAKRMEPLKGLKIAVCKQATRLASAKSQAAKQVAKDAPPEADAVAAAQPKKKAEGKNKAGLFANVPVEHSKPIAVIDWKDHECQKKLQAILQSADPFILMNSPSVPQMQTNTDIRLQLLVFKASVGDKNTLFKDNGRLCVPLGSDKQIKKKVRADLSSKILGGESALVELDPKQLGALDPDEIFCFAAKEQNELCTTEFVSMGAMHLVSQGAMQFVLIDFRDLAGFVRMASERVPNTDGSLAPSIHPAKVLDFMTENLDCPEMLKEAGNYGVRFHTGTAGTNSILVVPPAFVRYQKAIGKGSTTMTMSIPYLSQWCTKRLDQYKFVLDAVEKFQKPGPENPSWKLMKAVYGALNMKGRPASDFRACDEDPSYPSMAAERLAEQKRLVAHVRNTLHSLPASVVNQMLRKIVALADRTTDTATYTVEVTFFPNEFSVSIGGSTGFRP